MRATLEALTDNIPTQIWEMIDESTYGYANAAHAAFLGKSRTEIEYSNIYSLLPKEEADLSIQNNRIAIEQKQSYRSEEWLTDAHGYRRLLNVTRTPFLGEDGTILYLSCTAEETATFHPVLSYQNRQAGSSDSDARIEELEDLLLEKIDQAEEELEDIG